MNLGISVSLNELSHYWKNLNFWLWFTLEICIAKLYSFLVKIRHVTMKRNIINSFDFFFNFLVSAILESCVFIL